MRKKSFGLMIVFLLFTANLFAADGDLIVNGKLDVAGYIKSQTGLCIGNDCRTAWPGGGGGGLSGSGTANYLPKWTSGSSLGNSLIYDNGTNVGIGTTNPATILNVATGNTDIRIGDGIHETTDSGLYVKTTNPIGGLFFETPAGGNPGLAVLQTVSGTSVPRGYLAYINGRTNMEIAAYAGTGIALSPGGIGPVITATTAGNVGIGTTSPSHQLELSTPYAYKLGGGTWLDTTSDARLKKNIQPYTKSLNEILQINPVTYQFNGKGGIGHKKVYTKKNSGSFEDIETDVLDNDLLSRTFVGVIAQDIQPVVPETVTSHKGKINDSDPDETDILEFNGTSLTYILINAVKELKAEIDSLNKQISDLKAKVK